MTAPRSASIARCLAIFLLLTLCRTSGAAPPAAVRFKAIAFDYFVLFDANSVVPVIEAAYPGHGAEFARAWRAKQFEYGFLRSIARRQTDFLKVTEDALVYTAHSMNLDLPPGIRGHLLRAYLNLKPWPDTEPTLRSLKAAGFRIVVLSNFNAVMLRANADAAGVTGLFDDLLSTDINGSYKPESRAYALAMKRLRIKKHELLFAAFGGWDVYGAKNFGYTTYWVNRLRLPAEELGLPPDATSSDLAGLVAFVDGSAVPGRSQRGS